MRLNMTKNELAKNIRRDLKEAFGKTAKFSVRSHYVGCEISIIVQVKEAHENYFKTHEEFERENLDLKLEGNSLYETLEKQFYANKLSALKDEVYTTIKGLANGYNFDNSDPYTDLVDVAYFLSITDDGGIVKITD